MQHIISFMFLSSVFVMARYKTKQRQQRAARKYIWRLHSCKTLRLESSVNGCSHQSKQPMIGVVTVYISRLVLYFLQYGSSYGELRAPKPAKQDSTPTPLPPAETLSQQKSRLLLRSARSFPHDLQHGGGDGGRKSAKQPVIPRREGSKNSQSSNDDVLSESFHTIGDITNPDIVDHVQTNPR